jgi:hypothetical protein
MEFPDIHIIEVIYTCDHHFFIALRDDADIDAHAAKLPGKIAGYPASYMLDREIKRPAWSALGEGLCPLGHGEPRQPRG